MMPIRTYGQTGLSVSAIGFGGMRFSRDDDLDTCAALVRYAYDRGIRYFDTAPGYARSEEIFGLAFREMRKTREARPFVVSTKTSKSDPDGVRADVEQSLKRMGLDSVDLLHVWCIKQRAEFDHRRACGVLDTFEDLRAQGQVGHIALSTHMAGTEIAAVLRDYPFAGILLGYSAMNFPYREAGVAAAAAHGCGVAVMNPLGGGMIPQHPRRFDFLRTRTEENVAQAALRFLLNDARISLALVGMADRRDIDEAVAAATNLQPYAPGVLDAMRAQLGRGFDALCTGCNYCAGCPQGIPVAKLMDAWNQIELTEGDADAVRNRLRYHWGIGFDDPCLNACTLCGRCEAQCTQKLPIRDRLQSLVRLTADGGGKTGG